MKQEINESEKFLTEEEIIEIFKKKKLSQITFIPGSLNTKRFCLKNWQQKDSRAKTN